MVSEDTGGLAPRPGDIKGADDYRQRVLDLVDSKVEGKESLAKRVPPAVRGQSDKKPPAKTTRRVEAKTAEAPPAKKAQAGRK
jgi:non-homologous end joining protein Ku